MAAKIFSKKKANFGCPTQCIITFPNMYSFNFLQKFPKRNTKIVDSDMCVGICMDSVWRGRRRSKRTARDMSLEVVFIARIYARLHVYGLACARAFLKLLICFNPRLDASI
jgi:hypothetical protein